MKHALTLTLIIFYFIKAHGTQNCKSILKEDIFLKISIAQDYMESVRFKVSDFASFSEHKKEIRTAYYIAAASGRNPQVIEQRLQAAIREMNQSFINPHEKGFIKAYYTIAAIEESKKIKPYHLSELKALLNANSSFLQSEAINFSYLYALSKGYRHPDILNRIKLALKFLNQASLKIGFETELSLAESQMYFYAVAKGEKLSQALLAVLKMRDQISNGPSLISSESYIEALYLSTVD